MRTLTVNRDQIVQALLDTQHASKPPTSYVVAFNPFDCSPITARVIYADTPSLAGGFTTNFQDEINVNLFNFLDDDGGKNSFTWGEAGEGTGPNGETTDADEEAAREWIDANLADRVTANGETFAVVYLPDARSDALSPSEVFVRRTLDMSENEQRARFVNEMDDADRALFVRLWRELTASESEFDYTDLVEWLPEAAPVATPKLALI